MMKSNSPNRSGRRVARSNRRIMSSSPTMNNPQLLVSDNGKLVAPLLTASKPATAEAAAAATTTRRLPARDGDDIAATRARGRPPQANTKRIYQSDNRSTTVTATTAKCSQSPTTVADKCMLNVKTVMSKLETDMNKKKTSTSSAVEVTALSSSSSLSSSMGDLGRVTSTSIPALTHGTSLAAPNLIAATSLGEAQEVKDPQEAMLSSSSQLCIDSTMRSSDAEGYIADEEPARPGAVWIASPAPGDLPEWSTTTSTTQAQDSNNSYDVFPSLRPYSTTGTTTTTNLLDKDNSNNNSQEDPATNNHTHAVANAAQESKLHPKCIKKTSVFTFFGMMEDDQDEDDKSSPLLRPSIMNVFRSQRDSVLPQAERISMNGRSSSFFMGGGGADGAIPAELQLWAKRVSKRISAITTTSTTSARNSRISLFGGIDNYYNAQEPQDLPPELQRWGKRISALNNGDTGNLAKSSNNGTPRPSIFPSTSIATTITSEIPPELKRWEKRISALNQQHIPPFHTTSTTAQHPRLSTTLDAPVIVVPSAVPIRVSTYDFSSTSTVWGQVTTFVDNVFSS